MIKKGEYDLWSMKMRQSKVSALKLSHAARPLEETMRKLLTYCFLQIPDIHLLKCNDHELKVFQFQDQQNIAFLSKEVKSGTLKQELLLYARNIPKGYTRLALIKVQTAPNCASHSEEIDMFFLFSQTSMPTTYDEEDLLLQIDGGEFAMNGTDLNLKKMIGSMEIDAEPVTLDKRTWIEELAIRNKVDNQEKYKVLVKNQIDRNKVIIEDWVDSDDEETVLNSS
ncbi:hypothetical protein Tco_1421084 [Tanacetum coccineum]